MKQKNKKNINSIQPLLFPPYSITDTSFDKTFDN